MSYYNYNYSPYFGQGGRQYPDPTADTYQRPPYSATNPNQGPHHAPISHDPNAYRSQGYEDVKAASNGPDENTRREYNQSSNPRTSVDTTALGSLAYASTLGQDSRGQASTSKKHPSMQHIVNYNRSSDSNSYDVPPLASQTKYPSTTDIPNISGQISTSNGSDRMSHREAQTSHWSEHGNRRPSQQYQHIPRPTSASDSRSIFHRNQWSTASAQDGKAQWTTHVSGHPRVQTSQQSKRLPVYSISTSLDSKQQNHINGMPSVELASSHQINSQQPDPLSSLNSSHQITRYDRTYAEPAPAVNHFDREQYRDQIPSTVDPSHVFDQYEYQRRQAVAKKQTSSISSSAATGLNSESSTEEQMKLEMKQMIEKMRDYKAKDPSLFSHIWEQVKKSQPPIRSSSQSNIDQSPQPETKSELVIADSASKPELDRGKFPAQRRRRGVKAPTSASSAASLAALTPPSTSSYSVQNVSGTMQHIMKSYHENLDPRLQSPQMLDRSRPEVIYAGDIESVVSENINADAPTLVNGHNRVNIPSPAPVVNMIPSPSPHVNNVDPPSKGTIWPEAHKWKLAYAATTALISANPGKFIHANDIHQILSRNPSYTELCEILEIRGFIVERGPFARTLLAAVPDLGSSQAQAKDETSVSELRTIPHPMTGHQSQTFRPRSPPQTVSNAPSAKLCAPPKPPTKEETARKRSFGDIVDLTALSDDDDLQPPPKVSRTDNSQIDDSASTPSPSDSAKDSMSSSNNLLNTSAIKMKADPISSASKTSQMNLSQYEHAALSVREKETKPLQREHLRSANVVRAMNRNDALRRSRYNPKTICRDILVSSGKHPTMASLNYHLQVLQRNFYDVDNNSDLSTFKWNVVDPGGEFNPSNLKSKPAEAVEIERDEATRLKIDVAPPKRNFEVPHKRRKKDQDSTSDASSKLIKINASESREPSLSRQDAGAGASTNYTHMATDVQPQSTPTLRRDHRAASGKRSLIQPIGFAAVTPTLTATNPISEQKRRGRPSGSKDKNPRKNAAVPSKANVSIRTGRPSSTIPNTTPARPSGLRQAMTPPDGVAIVIESRSPSVITQSGPRSVATGGKDVAVVIESRSPSVAARNEADSIPTGRNGIAVVIESPSPSLAKRTEYAFATSGKGKNIGKTPRHG